MDYSTMKLLLDTRAFLWWDSSDTRLPDALRSAIASPGNEIFVSAVTVWEIAIKRASGKLVFHASAEKAIEEQGFLPLPIQVEHAEWAGSLPQLHRDPFDRLLVAQAQLEGLILVSVDKQILRYQVPHL
ncbi:MAG TPA: type II toxin-antitoxin system VapC family toxin [Terracidiphilus sp.]|nr:type II toxin-antitoxin system VapC family toxin [Terracidiphilus sp.]